MNKTTRVVCYMRVGNREQLDEREQKLRTFAKEHNYTISDFIIEQRNGLAPCSEILKELLHNQSVRNVLTLNTSSLSRDACVLQGIVSFARAHMQEPRTTRSRTISLKL